MAWDEIQVGVRKQKPRLHWEIFDVIITKIAPFVFGYQFFKTENIIWVVLFVVLLFVEIGFKVDKHE
jgi:hypothetical protein